MGDSQDNSAPPPPSDKPRAEDAYGRTWDRCITDLLVKMGGGLGLGVVFSVVLFGRRPWPMFFGLGSGFGMAYSNCQKAFNDPFAGNYVMAAKPKDAS